MPPFVGLIQRLGIDENEFMRATDGTYKLGIKFVGWHERSDSYFHPFGVIGKPIGNHDFYQCWLKARSQGDTSELQDFSPCNVMAEQGRFFHPSKARNTPIGGANYALHVDALLVAKYLRKYSEERGLKRTEGKVVGVKQRDDGFIESVTLASGAEVHGRLLHRLHGLQGIPDRQDARRREPRLVELPAVRPRRGLQDREQGCARAVHARQRAAGGLDLAHSAAASRRQWLRVFEPVRERRHREGDIAALAGFACIEEPRVIPYTTGHRKQFWKHNCLSLGLASGFIEPLEATSIHLIARGMDFFLRYFPDRDCEPALIREYNRRMIADFEEVRDFIVLHYSATARDDTPFWQHCRNLPLPDTLRERIELFKAHGAMREGVDELFRASSWQSVFEGMGIRPASPNPRVENLDYAQIEQTLRNAKAAIAGMVEHLPTHEQFLRTQTA